MGFAAMLDEMECEAKVRRGSLRLSFNCRIFSRQLLRSFLNWSAQALRPMA